MLDPQNIDFVRRLVFILGCGLAFWFVCVFLWFYFQGRREEKIRQRIGRKS